MENYFRHHQLQNSKEYEIESEAKFQRWILPQFLRNLNKLAVVALLSFGCAACSSHLTEIKNLKPWTSVPNLTHTSLCSAEASIDVKSAEENFKADVQMHFLYDRQNSELEMLFFTPFGTTHGMLEINPKKRLYRESSGKVYSLDEHPLLRPWFQGKWWQEIAFVFGKVVPGAERHILQDENALPRIYQSQSRRLRCDYDHQLQPTQCVLVDEDADFRAFIKLTSVVCRRPVS